MGYCDSLQRSANPAAICPVEPLQFLWRCSSRCQHENLGSHDGFDVIDKCTTPASATRNTVIVVPAHAILPSHASVSRVNTGDGSSRDACDGWRRTPAITGMAWQPPSPDAVDIQNK